MTRKVIFKYNDYYFHIEEDITPDTKPCEYTIEFKNEKEIGDFMSSLYDLIAANERNKINDIKSIE